VGSPPVLVGCGAKGPGTVKIRLLGISRETASVVLWSEFLATDPEARVRFPALPEKK
jgi:hypothetical protein